MDQELSLLLSNTIIIGGLFLLIWAIVGILKHKRKISLKVIDNHGCKQCKYYLYADEENVCTYGIIVKVDPIKGLPYACGNHGMSHATQIFPTCENRRSNNYKGSELKCLRSTSSPQALFGDCGEEGKFFEAR